MTGVLDLVRNELRDFAGYASARRTAATGSVWLNANESPWCGSFDGGQGLNRYPDPQPETLRKALAALYGTTPGQVLIGRGSDEAIDLLVRALCRPGRDAVLVTPPVFGMYAVSARLQGVPLIEAPLRDGPEGFHSDVEALIALARSHAARLVFLCSPANPTGQAMLLEEIAAIADALHGEAVVVVDEAYGEYSDQPSAVGLMPGRDNLAVLRTLSKAHALAAARIGCLLAAPELIHVLRCCQAPYPLPAPCVELALSALSLPALAITRERVALVRSERERMRVALSACTVVRRVYASQGNFLLLRFTDADIAFRQLLAAGVVVRDMRAHPQLGDALRISIGSPEENDRVLGALSSTRVAA